MTRVQRLGWAGIRNSELLARMEGRFDVLVTMDRSMQYQQNMTGRSLALVVLRARSSRLDAIQPLINELLSVIESAQPGEVYTVGSA